MQNTAPPLLDTNEMRLLEGMRLLPRRTFGGHVRGERISRNKGISIEFADYREYSMGDDLRHLDWNILARLDRPIIRTYQDEDDLAVYLALDTSHSMEFGEPSKMAHVRKIAALFGFLGLIGQDAVYPVTLGREETNPARVLRGRGNFHLLNAWLNACHAEGKRGLSLSLTRFAQARKARPGLFLCLTDGLDPNVAEGLRAVAARGHEIVLIQTLSPIEINPELEGDLRLLDSETGEAVEITAHSQTLKVYRANLEAHCKMLEETTLRCGGRYLQSFVGQSIAEFIQSDLKRFGLAK
jgi:uncharacterized protein (DUF58 family)